MAGGADPSEETVGLAELALALVLVTVLARQLGTLDVDHRLDPPVALRARQLLRAQERGVDLLPSQQTLCGQQDAGEHDVRDELDDLLAPAQQRDCLTTELDGALRIAEAQVCLPADLQAPAIRVGGGATLGGDRV